MMGYPFLSAYPYLMRASGGGGSFSWDGSEDPSSAGTGSSLPPIGGSAFTDVSTDPGSGFHGTGPGFGPTGVSGSPGVDPGVRHRALAAGISALGASLLESSGKNDWAGGLGRGITGFSEAYGGTLDAAQKHDMAVAEMRRKAALDERESRAAADTHVSSVLHNKIDSGKYDQSVQDAADAEKSAQAKSAAAKVMVANIQTLSQRSPGDAKLQAIAQRAAAFDLGDAADLNKLADLHEQMTGQAFHAQDAAQKTDDTVAGRRAEIDAGVLADPRADLAVRKQQVGIAQGHLDVSRQRAAQAASGGGHGAGGVTTAAMERQIQTRAAKKYDQMVRAKMATSFRPLLPADKAKFQQQALAEATQEVQGAANTVLKFSGGKFYTPSADDDSGDDGQ
jgi:hypothetical protein